MTKRRFLTSGQQAIIIYTVKNGYCQDLATFIKYEKLNINGVDHNIPVFQKDDEKISGLDCFWILPEDFKSQDFIQKIQYEIISLQIEASYIAKELGYKIPRKIKSKEIDNMVNEKFDRMQSMVKKLGFDPRDESWIEKEMAQSKREREWFAFERQNPILLSNTWADMTKMFNEKYKDNASVEEIKNLSKKRTRFLLGALHTRMSGNAKVADWREAARKFEQLYRDIENRMISWSLSKNGKFPLVKTKQPIKFTSGAFFHKCIEKIPHYFTDTKISAIKENIVLRVVSYDSVSNNIRLDFVPEVRRILRGAEPENTNPWTPLDEDYIFWLKPEEIETKLNILEKL